MSTGILIDLQITLTKLIINSIYFLSILKFTKLLFLNDNPQIVISMNTNKNCTLVILKLFYLF